MNYLKHYCKLIRKAEKRNTLHTHKEKHHIFPISIFGKNNRVVNLTPREHYVAHLLLEKICIKRYGLSNKRTIKMNKAVLMMSGRLNTISNSFLYEQSKIRWSLYMKENNPMKDKNISNKVSKKLKGRNKDDYEYLQVASKKKSEYNKNNNENIKKGRDKFRKTISLMSEEERKEKFGRIITNEMKENLSKTRKGKTAENCERVKKMKETKNKKILEMSDEERKKNFGKTKGMSWFYNDDLKLNKLFNLNDVPFGWIKGRKNYEKN
jgi:hypothetical protein